MWSNWFSTSLPAVAGVVLSVFGLYLAIIVFARWAGVRSFAELSTVDIAVTIALGSTIASTATAKNPALLQGLVAVATLYILQLLSSRLRSRVRTFEAATDNAPILLMGPGGEMKRDNMRVARVTENDLRTHLRAANVADLKTVRAVVMEGTGAIHVLHGGSGELDPRSWVLRDVRDYTP